jgi:hypothetical protein
MADCSVERRTIVIVVVGMQSFGGRAVNGKLRQLIVHNEIGRNGLARRHELLQNGAQVLIDQITAAAVAIGTVTIATTDPFRDGIEQSGIGTGRVAGTQSSIQGGGLWCGNGRFVPRKGKEGRR